MLTALDLDEAVATIAEIRDAVGESVTWRDYQGTTGMPPVPTYVDTPIKAVFKPIAPGLITSGLYMVGDLEMMTNAAVAMNDQIIRAGITYTVLEEPFLHHLGDRITGYETKVRAE